MGDRAKSCHYFELATGKVTFLTVSPHILVVAKTAATLRFTMKPFNGNLLSDSLAAEHSSRLCLPKT
jgi:hypothetical protein